MTTETYRHEGKGGDASTGQVRSTANDADSAEQQLELVQLYARQAPAVMAVNVINAVLVCAVVWPRVEGSAVIVWAIALVVFALLRGGFWYSVSQRGKLTTHAAARWRQAAIFSSAAGGIGWGVGGLLVFLCSESSLDHVFMAFVLGGMSAGSMAGLTAMLPVFYASVWPMLLPYGIILITGWDFMHIAMGAMVLIFTGAVSLFTRNVNQWVVSAIRLRHENEGL